MRVSLFFLSKTKTSFPLGEVLVFYRRKTTPKRILLGAYSRRGPLVAKGYGIIFPPVRSFPANVFHLLVTCRKIGPSISGVYLFISIFGRISLFLVKHIRTTVTLIFRIVTGEMPEGGCFQNGCQNAHNVVHLNHEGICLG